jgi:hypothetical protein
LNGLLDGLDWLALYGTELVKNKNMFMPKISPIKVQENNKIDKENSQKN